MPRFMPTERHAVCSAFGRLAMTGPTSQAAANNSAVLPLMTARYSSSVVAVFLAAASCITSPSAIVAAPQFAFVDHVVMQQGGGMHEFHGGGELDMPVAGIAGEMGHRQRQHRPQPLAARRNQVVGHLRDHDDFRTGSRQNGGVDALHIRRDKPNQLIYRSARRALEGYNNRHAGLHICPIRTILTI